MIIVKSTRILDGLRRYELGYSNTRTNTTLVRQQVLSFWPKKDNSTSRIKQEQYSGLLARFKILVIVIEFISFTECQMHPLFHYIQKTDRVALTSLKSPD